MADDAPPLTGARAVADSRLEFEAFVRAQTTSLLRTARLLTGDAASAEDLVQETLLRLYPKWASVHSPLAYARRGLVNAHLNRVRSASARELPRGEFTDRPDSDDALGRATDRTWILHMLSALPDRQRAALVLCYLDELSAREIANVLGCRTGTARSLISRGLATLRNLDSASGGRYV